MKATKPAPTLPTYCAIFSNKGEYSYLSTEPEGNMSDELCGTNVRKGFVNCSCDTTSVIKELCNTLSDKSEVNNTKCMKVKK